MNIKKGLPVAGLLALAMALPVAVTASGGEIKCKVKVEGVAEIEQVCRSVTGKWSSEVGEEHFDGPVRSVKRNSIDMLVFWTSPDCMETAVVADLADRSDDPSRRSVIRCVIPEVIVVCGAEGAECKCKGKIEGEGDLTRSERAFRCKGEQPNLW